MNYNLYIKYPRVELDKKWPYTVRSTLWQYDITSESQTHVLQQKHQIVMTLPETKRR